LKSVTPILSYRRFSWWFELKYPQGFGCLVILMTLIVGVTSIRMFLVPTQISTSSFFFKWQNYVLDPLLKRWHLTWYSGELNPTPTFRKLAIKSQNAWVIGVILASYKIIFLLCLLGSLQLVIPAWLLYKFYMKFQFL